MCNYKLIGLNNYIFLNYIEPIQKNKEIEQRYLDYIAEHSSELTEVVSKQIMSKFANSIFDDIVYKLLKMWKR